MRWNSILLKIEEYSSNGTIWQKMMPYGVGSLILIIVILGGIRIGQKYKQFLGENPQVLHQARKVRWLMIMLLLATPALAALSLIVSAKITALLASLLLVIAGFRVSRFFELLYIVEKNHTNSLLILRYVYLGVMWPLRFFSIGLSLLIMQHTFTWSEKTTVFISRIFDLMITLSVGYFASKMIEALGSYLVEKKAKEQSNTLDVTAAKAITLVLRAILIIFVTISIIRIFSHESLSAIIAGLGIGGAAIALASQDILKNIFGGFTIMLDNPFKIGERIQIDAIDGVVEEIGFRSTRIRLLNGQLTTVPNQLVANASINNITKRPHLRRDIQLFISLDTPKDKVHRLADELRNYFKTEQATLTVPESPPLIYFEDIAERGFLIKIVYRHNTQEWDEYVRMCEVINLDILSILDNLKITLAVPMRRVSME